MAWRYAPDACGGLEPSSIFSAKSLHDSGDSVARLGDDRQTGPDFLGAFAEPEYDPCSFAVGGKGLASVAGAADARNKPPSFQLGVKPVCMLNKDLHHYTLIRRVRCTPKAASERGREEGHPRRVNPAARQIARPAAGHVDVHARKRAACKGQQSRAARGL